MISVIVPVYKVENYIRRCIESIQAQTYQDLEIILVDDGSNDNCPQICDEYALKDSRIQVIHQDNGGLSKARNVGLSVARGEYVAFVDGDDYIKPDMYETLLGILIRETADMVICSYDKVDENNSRIENESPICNESLEGFDLFQKFANKKGWYYITVWNRLYKREIFDKICFPEGKMHEDEFVAHKIADACKRVVTISDGLYCYRASGGSIMTKHPTVERLDGVEAIYNRFCFYQEKGYSELYRGAYSAARNAMEVMRYITCKTREEKARKTEVKRMYRNIFRESGIRKGFKEYLLAWFPELYFGIKNRM